MELSRTIRKMGATSNSHVEPSKDLDQTQWIHMALLFRKGQLEDVLP